MMAGRTFGAKLAGGFGLAVAFTLVIAAASAAALTVVVNAKDRVIARATEDLAGAEQLNTLAVNRISDYRAYLLNGRPEFLDLTRADRTRFLDQVGRLQGTVTDSAEASLLAAVSTAEAQHAAVLEDVIQRRS
jgi:CHASE3 domain sensor protein